MSGTSGPTSRTPFAFYDPASRSLRTSQTTFDLGLPMSSPTLPASGSMRNGRLYGRRRSALPTTGDASSSSPGLPTPRARDSRGRGFEDALPNVVALLPTPTTSEATGPGHAARGGMNLRHTVSLLPTPAAADSRESANFRPDGTPYSSGYGMTLTDASRHLLPTPRASDGEKGGPNQRGSKGDWALPSAVVHLLPTPVASDGERNSPTYSRGNPTLRGAVSCSPSDAGKPSSADPLPGQLTIEDA